MPIPESWQQRLAEAAYQWIRSCATRQQTADIISRLLSDNELSSPTKSVVIRMAMIFSAEEGHS